MTPDDPRHGTSAGYCAGCHDTCCRVAIADYSRHLRTRQYLAGGPLVIDAVGTKRRIRALMALGWSGRQIDAALGKKPTYTTNLLCGPTKVNRATADMVAAIYDRWSMRVPDDLPGVNRQVIARSRTVARRKGWPPPLAWDNIDDPDEAPVYDRRRQVWTHDAELERWVRWWTSRGYDDLDHAVVERVLSGAGKPRRLTESESVLIVRRALAAGMSGGTIEDLYGIKTERYTAQAAAA